MVVKRRAGSWLVSACAGAALLAVPTAASAADITDVLDAFDEHVIDGKILPDYFDFALEPTFKQTLTRAKITREINCSGDPDRCPGEATILVNKELRYERIVSQMDLDFRLGMYKDLEFKLNLPIIFGDVRSLKYARNGGDACEFLENPNNPKCVNETNSTVDPSDARIIADRDDGGDFTQYKYFDIPGEEEFLEGPSRAGLGDIGFSLSWAPFNDERYVDHVNPEVWGRNHGRAALKLGVTYTAPTSAVARNEIDNEDVGRGLHQLQFDIATSRRYKYVDPYVGFRFGLNFASADSLFRKFGTSQERVEPGPWGDLTFGLELIPWEEVGEQWQQNFKVNLSGRLGFQGEGRDYSPLFDALGSSDCQGLALQDIGPGGARPECGWLGERWANAGFEDVAKMDPNNGAFDAAHPLHDDGTSSQEGYGYFAGTLGLSVQPIQYIVVKTAFSLGFQQERFISFAKAGEDVRGRQGFDDDGDGIDDRSEPSSAIGKDGTVSFDDIEERNPVYNPKTDAVGKRFRQEETTVFTWNVGLAFLF